MSGNPRIKKKSYDDNSNDRYSRSDSRDNKSRSYKRSNSREKRSNKRSRSRSRDKNYNNDDSKLECRELFVGNVIAKNCTEEQVKQFLNQSMREAGLIVGDPNIDPIIKCRLNTKFCFIEFSNSANCNNGMILNGIPFMGALLRVGRPERFPGPHLPTKTWQEHMLSRQTLIPNNSSVPSMPLIPSNTLILDPNTRHYREIFIGNTNDEMTTQALSEFLSNLLINMCLTNINNNENPIVSIRHNGKFSFVECRTLEDAANLLNFNGVPFLNHSLRLNRPSKFESNNSYTFYNWEELLATWQNGQLKVQTAGPISRVLCISNMVNLNDLNDPFLYAELLEDTRMQCQRFGQVLSIIAPRYNPNLDSNLNKGVGKVFVCMSNEQDAIRALIELKGKKFDNSTVDVKFYSEVLFHNQNYHCDSLSAVITKQGPIAIEQLIPALATITKRV